MTDKLHRRSSGLDDDHATSSATPGKRSLTQSLAGRQQIVFRVESAEAAQVFAETFGPRDRNGVAAGADAAVDRAAGSSGSPLPSDLRGRFESSLGADLSSVRIHTGGESAEASKAVGAKAYTTGQDIHFAEGNYDPSSAFGVHLLAHEVAHTVQQQGSTPTRQNKLEVSTPQDSAEVEADRAADAMVSGAQFTVASSSGLTRQIIQRDSDGGGGAPSDSQSVPDDGSGGPKQDPCDEDCHDERDAKEQKERERDLEVKWIGMGSLGQSPAIDVLHSEWHDECPTMSVTDSGLDIAPTCFGAFKQSWAEVQGGYNKTVASNQDYALAASRAKQLGLQSNANDARSAGWNAPKNVTKDGETHAPNVEEYAEQQGAEGGPTVAEMFKGGSLPAETKALDKANAGLSTDTKTKLKEALGERQKQMGAVTSAAMEVDLLNTADATAKLAEIKSIEINVDSVKLDGDAAKKELELEAIKHENTQINAAIDAAVGAINSGMSALKTETAPLRAAEGFKSGAGTINALVNIAYAEKMRGVATQIGAIKVKQLDNKYKQALAFKEKAIAEYSGWFQREYVARANKMKDAYLKFKEADAACENAFRAAGSESEKGKQAASATPMSAKDQQKASDAAGGRAASLFKAKGVIETVITSIETARTGVMTKPAYSSFSGIGFHLAGRPAQICFKLHFALGFAKSYDTAKQTWDERLKEVDAVVDSYAA